MARKQPETARKETARDRGSRRQAAWKFPEAVFPIQRHGFEGQRDLGQGCRSAHTLTRAHTHSYIIYLFIHNRYKCLSEIKKGINSHGSGGGGRLGSGREPQDGAVECSPCSTEGGRTHPILKNINWPHDTILMRGNTGKGRVREPKPRIGAGAGRGEARILGNPAPWSLPVQKY